MRNITFNGIITATSKKQSEDFVSKVKTKTAYLEVDEKTAIELENFGLTKYSSREDGSEFFIVKFSSNLVGYIDYAGSADEYMDLSDLAGIESANFKTNQPIGISVIEGENLKSKFYRIDALLLSPDLRELEKLERKNPFAM